LSTLGISVIIPNYNGQHLLPLILPAAFIALQKTKLAYEVIVSDDCSTDNSIAFLQHNFTTVKIIESPINKGFSPTANAGVFAAKFKYILLLNSDVKLTEDYFLPLLRYFDKPDTFGVMGKIIGWDDDLQQDGAKYPSFHGVKIKTTGNYILTNPNQNDWVYSMYLSGANALIDKNKLIELGGFNELYAPFYVEDYDLSLRAWRLGYKCYYEHFALCRHQVSTSIKIKTKKNAINTIYYRNKLYLHFIHLSGINLWLWFLQLVPEVLFSLITGKFYFFTSLSMFFCTIDKAKKAKLQLYNSAKKKQPLLSVKEVANTILSSLKNKKTHRF
jgi:GT2 family glycosyltransferase